MKACEPVKDKSMIFETLKNIKENLLMLGVVSLGLFGSFVRGEQAEESDIDFLVEFSEGNRTFDNLMELGFLLEDMLGRRVEVVTFQAMSPTYYLKCLKKWKYFMWQHEYLLHIRRKSTLSWEIVSISPDEFNDNPVLKELS